jgi:hypothetical protein
VRLSVTRVATCLLFGLSLSAGAQQSALPPKSAGIPLVPGSRVRVTATSLVAPLVANYLELRGDTLVLFEEQAGRGIWSVTLDQVQLLETTVGMKRGHAPYVVRGAAIGAGIGALGGAIFASASKPSDPGRKYSRPLSALVGAGTGVLLGGFIGSRFSVEKWSRVPLPNRLGFMPGRAGGVYLTLEF